MASFDSGFDAPSTRPLALLGIAHRRSGFRPTGSACGAPHAGSLLIITLWLVAILSVLAIAVARYLSVEVRLTQRRLASDEALALARSGVYLAMQRLDHDAQPKPDGKVYDALGDAWAADQNLSQDGGQVTIRITDDERRLDLNTVSEPVLTRLLDRVAGSSNAARPILDDLDPDDEGPVMGEPPYYPKNAPMAALEELVDIPQVRDIYPALRPFLTVALGAAAPPTVNINTAGREVLLALGADAAVVDALITARPGRDQAWGTDDDCRATDVSQAAVELAACALAGDTARLLPLLSLPTATVVVSSSTFRVNVDALAEARAARHRIEAVIQRTPDGPKILAWREE